MKKAKARERTKAFLETAGGMHRVGTPSNAAYAKITKRHAVETASVTPKDIRDLRERAKKHIRMAGRRPT